MKCNYNCRQGRECDCLPVDFDGQEPDDDVSLTITEMIGVALFVAALLAAGFLLGRVTA